MKLQNIFENIKARKLKEETVFHGTGEKHRTKFKAPLFLTVEKSHANWFAINNATDDEGLGIIYQGSVDLPKSKIVDAYSSTQVLFDIMDELGIKYEEEPYFDCPAIDAAGGQGHNISDIVYVPKFKKWMKANGKTALLVSDVVETEEHKTYVLFDPSDFKIEKIMPGQFHD